MTPFVRFVPLLGGASVTITGVFTVERDAIGNHTFSWRDPLASWTAPQRLAWQALQDVLCENVDVKRNREGAVVAITDPGGALVRVEWREIDPWQGALRPQQNVVGVVALASTRSSAEDDLLSVIVYRAGYRYQRAVGVLEEAP